MISSFEPIILIYGILNRLPKKRIIQIYFSLFLMILSALSESLTLSISLPFLASLSNPRKLYEFKLINYFLSFFSIDSSNNLIIPVVIIFCIAICISAALRLLNIWVNCKVIALIGNDLGRLGYSNILKQSYSFHIDTKSSQLITGLTSKLEYCLESIYSSFQFFLSIAISFSIILTLLFINWQSTILSTFIFLIIYLLISSKSRKYLTANSKLISQVTDQQVRFIQNGLGNIREIILGQLQNKYVSIYGEIDREMRTRYANNRFIGLFPRYILEAAAICIVSILSIFLFSETSNSKIPVAILGSLALGAQKLLPALQNIYNSWANISSRKSEIESVLKILNLKSKLIFTKELQNFPEKNNLINFKNVTFVYKKLNSIVFKNINLSIPLEKKIGIIGTTGSGKSTFIDLLMGFILPTEGEIIINNKPLRNKKNLREWQNCISHVPQDIYISDISIAENIAFGLNKNEINIARLKEAAKIAEIDEFIESLQSKYNTKLGERGMQLSGGQRQRLGIARAIYRKTKIIILDEATSALDVKTEKRIFENINKFLKNKTILMITHRPNTLEKFDHIYKVEKQTITKLK
ncbi:ABC transporter ATP-binding protein [Prochlorococcus marinus]|uniref:ABC transporter ATP-binding protein n=1 Tax=Prochlorococcus marinus TaxID=1219 RepID=UPI001ADCC0FA|nr:ABC transporter ATP-binding protein [Prochlorococcus marinus]MBO8204938.1 ABC transporter ATP-binding protein [Prochlorococcus marinus CUG1415]MBW3044210.1 hypothetical protein [Prochlorococcus marinus str. MU1415]